MDAKAIKWRTSSVLYTSTHNSSSRRFSALPSVPSRLNSHSHAGQADDDGEKKGNHGAASCNLLRSFTSWFASSTMLAFPSPSCCLSTNCPTCAIYFSLMADKKMKQLINILRISLAAQFSHPCRRRTFHGPNTNNIEKFHQPKREEEEKHSSPPIIASIAISVGR